MQGKIVPVDSFGTGTCRPCGGPLESKTKGSTSLNHQGRDHKGSWLFDVRQQLIGSIVPLQVVV